jgi:hypothetical protein
VIRRCARSMRDRTSSPAPDQQGSARCGLIADDPSPNDSRTRMNAT